MATRGPWSVKGIDAKAREAALQAARSEGVTLGDYLNRLLLESDQPGENMPSAPEQQTPSPSANDDRRARVDGQALDDLTRRIEAAEARSRLAITGIDQSVVQLLSRLENAEKSQAAMEGRLDFAADEIQQAQDMLKRRIDQIEAEDTSHQSLRALRSLEHALEGLSSRVEKARIDAEAHKARSEEKFTDIDGRLGEVSEAVTSTVDSLKNDVASSIEEASARVERTVSEATARTEGTARHLAERMTQVELDVADVNRNVGDTLTQVSQSVERFGNNIAASEERSVKAFDLVSRLEEQARHNTEEIDEKLSTITERLNNAETSTDAALAGLESSVAQLDDRFGQFAEDFENEGLAGIRAELEERLRAVKDEMAQTVQDTRADLATQIEAATSVSTEAFSEMNTAVSEISKRMRRTEMRQTQAVEAIGEEVASFADKLDKRVMAVEQRNQSDLAGPIRDQISQLAQTFHRRISELEGRENAPSLEPLTQKMNELADALSARVESSEERSAKAIRDFTEHVTTLTKNLQARQDESIGRISEEIKASEGRQRDNMDEALGRVTDRISAVEEAASSSISPIQRAMASLAERLQAVEEFSSPDGMAPKSQETYSFDSFEARLDAADRKTDAPAPAPKPAAAEPAPAATSEAAALASLTIPEPEEAPKPKAESKPAPVTTESEDDFDLPFDEDWDNPNLTDDKLDTKDFDADDGFLEPMDHDDGFAADVPGSGFDLDDAEYDETRSDDNVRTLPGDAPAGDYLSRARAAALAAQDNGKSRRKENTSGGNGGKSSKIPLVAAASVIALTAVGTAGYMMMRGKQDAGLSYLDGANASGSVDGSTPLVPSEAGADMLNGEMSSALPEDELDAGMIDAPSAAEIEAVEEAPAPAATRPAPSPTPSASAPAPAPASTQRETQPASSQPSMEEARLETPASNTAEATTRDLNRSQLADASPAINAGLPRTPVNAQTLTPSPVSQFQEGMRFIDAGQIREGVVLVRAAADSGLAIAEYRMSKLYERGQGVPRDLAQSREWVSRAAEGGNVNAMHDLAVFFAEGEGGPQSYAGAAQWFRAAAEYGLLDSQFNLGVLYEQGLGVTASPEDALYWYAVAERMGDSGASANVSQLAASLSPTVAQSVLDRAAAFTPSPRDELANGIFPEPAQAAVATSSAQIGELSLNTMVRDAQTMLNELGYNAGFPDGRFGNQTRSAIIAFQSANGYPQSGQVTPTLLRQIEAAADEAEGIF